MAVAIKPFCEIVPMIYAYTTPGVPAHDGWTKVGYTEAQTVEQRIKQQTHTADIEYKIEWQDNAIYKDGSGDSFRDTHFHSYLTRHGIERKDTTEWFHEQAMPLWQMFATFARREVEQSAEQLTYTLRAEQERAVSETLEHFRAGGTQFLWNAKPRFGKTLTAYDLVQRLGALNVLVVTNRPSIANSWAEDFYKFIGWQGKYLFVSDTDALQGRAGVLTRAEYLRRLDNAAEGEEPGMIAFESLQGLKGARCFGGKYDKLEWMSRLHFDLLIVDESQEGVDTVKSDTVFRHIDCAHTLYLSGTPFKQLASGDFSEQEIFNWSYGDEQEAKRSYAGEAHNPYERLPQLNLLTYQLSNMLAAELTQGADLSDEGAAEYAFDLNEFFATRDNGRFVHEADVARFLDTLSTGEKYPYAAEYRGEMQHTLWLLNRVASAKALANMLKNHPVFGEYEIVVAAGDGVADEEQDRASADAYTRVKQAIATHDRTITLSVGQLTVGITVPEWSGVLMLCNMKSPSSYMQAAFRAQNPCMLRRGASFVRKDNAYVFDFDPARTLIIYDEFATNLTPATAGGAGTSEEHAASIRRLKNFFPVIGEDEAGRMVELDAEQILSIPRRLKCREVVRRGFMSNYLFANISGIFGAPTVVRDIISRITPAQEFDMEKARAKLAGMEDIPVNEQGEVEVPEEIVIGRSREIFGPKVYEEIEDRLDAIETVADAPTTVALTQVIESASSQLLDTLTQTVIPTAVQGYELGSRSEQRLTKELTQTLTRQTTALADDTRIKANNLQTVYERQVEAATTTQEVERAESELQAGLAAITADVSTALQNIVQTMGKTDAVVGKLEQLKQEEHKKSVEDGIRDNLRGFARTIPSFLMAYGDENLTLANIDDYTEDEVFLEVTGISEEDFRFLRDGGDRLDENGVMQHFDGHLFDERTFNDSVQEFLARRRELANYFDETQTEDIFNYIPPQRTNQIFTPRAVVQQMVDELEQENPGCFDDPEATFADLYMKSGLYITEIVKRLYRSERLRALYPDDDERLRHILERQVYGLAPTRIIYLIATNFIFGIDETGERIKRDNFQEADSARAAIEGRLAELVDEVFAK